MKIHLNPTTRTCREMPDDAQPAEGFVVLDTIAELEAWKTANPPEPEPYVAPVPSEVGSGQIRAALVAEGWVTITTPSTPDPEIDAWVSALIEAAVANPGQKAIAYLLWHNASVFKRTDQFVLMVAALTGKTSEQIDQLFTTANTF